MNADTEYKCTVRIAGNTLTPCLQAIAKKGYVITHYFLGDTPNDYDRPQWDAVKEGRLFSATSPEELLGLIAMWEVRGDDWRIKAGENDLYNQLLDSAPIYDNDGNIIDT